MRDINSTYRLRKWKHIIDNLCDEKGTSLKEICDYIGAAYNEDLVSFYTKLPRKRNVYIGIGMALKQDLETINGWITGFAGKRKLYVKDISEDLVWIYLIHANLKDDSGAINYYRRYEDFQSAAYSIFQERWEEIILRFEDTSDVEISLGQMDLGTEYDGIKAFVAEHMDAFKTAYSKPRAFLDLYVDKIISTCRKDPDNKTIKSLNSMRGYLDDSMINFLSGDSGSINVVDKVTGKKTIKIKHIPKGRKKYINLCISLGMTCDDIKKFITMMGYAPLDVQDRDDGELLTFLTDWEHGHPVQRAFKKKYFGGDDKVVLTDAEEFRAVNEMLSLKSELLEEYSGRGKSYPYS